MKQILQIIGAEVCGQGILPDGSDIPVKLTCIPFTSEKVKMKKPSMFDIAKSGAGVMEIMREAEASKTRLTILYTTLGEYDKEFHHKLLTKITMDVSAEEFYGE